MWLGPGGYHRPGTSRDLSARRTRGATREPRATDHTPVNIYNRPSNISRVDPVASRQPHYQLTRSSVRPPRLQNNVYAGRDGRVYQRDERGVWRVNDGRTWRPTRMPPTTPPMTTGDVVRTNSPPFRRNWPPAYRPVSPGNGGRSGETPARRGWINYTPPAPAQAATPLRPTPEPGALEPVYRARQRADQGAAPGGGGAPPAAQPATPPAQPRGWHERGAPTRPR
jgi:hypothetical protein